MAVGAPRPDWAEIEPKIWKESLVYVDSFAGAKTEAGDLIQSNCEVTDELGGFIKKGKLPFSIWGIQSLSKGLFKRWVVSISVTITYSCFYIHPPKQVEVGRYLVDCLCLWAR